MIYKRTLKQDSVAHFWKILHPHLSALGRAIFILFVGCWLLSHIPTDQQLLQVVLWMMVSLSFIGCMQNLLRLCALLLLLRWGYHKAQNLPNDTVLFWGRSSIVFAQHLSRHQVLDLQAFLLGPKNTYGFWVERLCLWVLFGPIAVGVARIINPLFPILRPLSYGLWCSHQIDGTIHVVLDERRHSIINKMDTHIQKHYIVSPRLKALVLVCQKPALKEARFLVDSEPL